MANTTQIQDPNGNLLWSPTSVAGKYSAAKVQEVADILKDLLQNVTITMNAKIDEDSLSNVYTKNQSDERFVLVTNLDSAVQGKVSELIIAGQIAGTGDINTVNSRLLTLWKSAYGTNFDGEQVQNTSFNQSIESLNDSVYANTQDILRVLNNLFAKNSDGSTIDFSHVLYASLADVGSKSDLSSAFSGANRSTLVNAINYTQSMVDYRNEIIGTGSLQTSATTLIAAINELLGLQNASNQTIVSLSGSISGIASNVTALTDSIADTKTSYNTMNSRVTAIETLDGSGSLTTADKTLIGGINEVRSELVSTSSDVTTLKSDVSDIKSDITNIKTNIGTLSNIDSSVRDTNIVNSLNKLVTLVSQLDSKVTGLDSRLDSVESSISSLDSRVSALEEA